MLLSEHFLTKKLIIFKLNILLLFLGCWCCWLLSPCLLWFVMQTLSRAWLQGTSCSCCYFLFLLCCSRLPCWYSCCRCRCCCCFYCVIVGVVRSCLCYCCCCFYFVVVDDHLFWWFNLIAVVTLIVEGIWTVSPQATCWRTVKWGRLPLNAKVISSLYHRLKF